MDTPYTDRPDADLASASALGVDVHETPASLQRDDPEVGGSLPAEAQGEPWGTTGGDRQRGPAQPTEGARPEPGMDDNPPPPLASNAGAQAPDAPPVQGSRPEEARSKLHPD